MYKLYEKVPKSKEYMYGSKPIDDNENPFKEGPCLLCISAQVDNGYANKSNFGVTKQGMKMARLRVKGEPNARFDLNKFPVKFLSMKLDKDTVEKNISKEERIEEFVDKYLKPLILKDGQKIDCIQAMKNMRNVNMMSYCDGTLLVQTIEKKLINKMQELGYTNEECDKIQSQMCMFPISTDRLNGTQKSSCISFKDINDTEVNDNITTEEEQIVKKSPIGESIIKHSDNEIAYLYDGDGAHDLKKYTKVGSAMSVCLSSVISKALENSIENYSRTDFVPVSTKLLMSDIDSIMQKATDGTSMDELMENLDNNLTYGGARRMTEFEAQLLDQLDESYYNQIKMQAELERKQKELEKAQENLMKTDDAIKENCTEITRLKILKARGYQFGSVEKIDLEKVESSPSDKQLIEGFKLEQLSDKDIKEIAYSTNINMLNDIIDETKKGVIQEQEQVKTGEEK